MKRPQMNTRDVVTPQSGLICYTDRYWVCKDGDPKQAMFYGTSPQCNPHKKLPEKMLTSTLYEGWNVSVVFVPVAFVPEH